MVENLFQTIEFGGISLPGMAMGVEFPGDPLGRLIWTADGYQDGTDPGFRPGDGDEDQPCTRVRRTLVQLEALQHNWL